MIAAIVPVCGTPGSALWEPWRSVTGSTTLCEQIPIHIKLSQKTVSRYGYNVCNCV